MKIAMKTQMLPLSLIAILLILASTQLPAQLPAGPDAQFEPKAADIALATTALTTFPNPAVDRFSVQYYGPDEIQSIELVSMQGNMLCRWEGPQLSYQLPASVAPGQYVVFLRTSRASHSARLVVGK